MSLNLYIVTSTSKVCLLIYTLCSREWRSSHILKHVAKSVENSEIPIFGYKILILPKKVPSLLFLEHFYPCFITAA